MDAEFWQHKWRSGEINFHEGRTNAMLAAHWPALCVAADATVLVPLCGKSRDLAWLAARGHRVVGVELSPIAARAFFVEQGLALTERHHDGFVILEAGSVAIWCGDLFRLQPHHIPGIAGVYDRASLVAFPPAMQPAYAGKLAALSPAGTPSLLVTVDYDQARMDGPPFATSADGVRALFGADFEVTELARRDVIATRPDLQKRGLSRLEQIALSLRRRAEAAH